MHIKVLNIENNVAVVNVEVRACGINERFLLDVRVYYNVNFQMYCVKQEEVYKLSCMRILGGIKQALANYSSS